MMMRMSRTSSSSRWFLPLVLSLLVAPTALAFMSNPNPPQKGAAPATSLRLSFLDDLLKQATGTGSSTISSKKIKSTPNVQVPKDFQVPEPKPLTITEGTDLVEFAKSTIAFALRLGTGAFTLGWKIDDIFFKDETKYSLKLGPLSVRDVSTVLKNAPRPSQPLILYEYDGSPYCKRVREMMNLLDLQVEYRPCPGARQGKFSKELYERTGRQTVPYLIDPNTGAEMFESNDQIEYLLTTYGPPSDQFDRKALWPITFEGFSIFTSSLVALLRNFPGSSRQTNAR